MRNEIGSEFWLKSYLKADELNQSEDKAVVLSGRSALNIICKDSKIESVLLPSYCCRTMIEPFLQNRVSVGFYSVNVDGTLTRVSNSYDAVLLIDYFGYIMPSMIALAKTYRKLGKTVIYDSTHKLDGNLQIEKYADYSLCSYRKWMYNNCAVLKKHRGTFHVEIPCNTNPEYLKMRDKAANLKQKYIENEQGEKGEFLSLFAEAEELLDKDGVDYRGVFSEFDKNHIINRRRENAENLMSALAGMTNVHLLRKGVGKNDTPLCVPILLKDELTRNELRRYLISKDIYCPVHWPLSKLHLIDENDKNIYYRELSLICDQRYCIDDMQREATEIRKFLKE